MKINRMLWRDVPDHCPAILRDNWGYDFGTCCQPLKEGHCKTHGNITTQAAEPTLPEQAADMVWFVRKDSQDGSIVASAQLDELQQHGLINDVEVKTTKGVISLTEFRTVIGIGTTPLYRQYTKGEAISNDYYGKTQKRPQLRVLIWL